MQLSTIENALLLAAYYRGNLPEDERATSCCDQVVTLSLYFTGDLSEQDCIERFKKRRYLSGLYDENAGELRSEISDRYVQLIQLVRSRPLLIRGFGNLETPAHPTYTACALAESGEMVALEVAKSFPPIPHFPNWPNRREI